MLIGFVQGYEELKWGTSKLNPLCNGPIGAFHLVRTHLGGVGGGGMSSSLYISIAYYMLKGGRGSR